MPSAQAMTLGQLRSVIYRSLTTVARLQQGQNDLKRMAVKSEPRNDEATRGNDDEDSAVVDEVGAEGVSTRLRASEKWGSRSNVHSGVVSIKGSNAAQWTNLNISISSHLSSDPDTWSDIIAKEAPIFSSEVVSVSNANIASAEGIRAMKSLSNEAIDKFEEALKKVWKPRQDLDQLAAAKPSAPHRIGRYKNYKWCWRAKPLTIV